MRRDLYATVTDTIVQAIERDPGRWTCPWHSQGGLPENANTGRAYRGINIITLWSTAQLRGFGDLRWASYQQWAELGAQVRKGEKATSVVFFKDLRAQDDASSEDDATRRRFVARSFPVFCADQVDRAPSVPAEPLAAASLPTPVFDRFVVGTGAIVRPGPSACYLPELDEIRIPQREAFHRPEGYAGTLAHELVHWTGHPSRLKRDLRNRFKTEAYAAEELVAELGAAFVLAALGLALSPHIEHARYIRSWLPLLHTDPRAIFTAAAQAATAADFLIGRSKPSAVDPATAANGQNDARQAA